MRQSNSPLRILGVDPGTKKAGYAVIDILSNKRVIVDTATIKLNKKKLTQRLFYLYESLNTIIKEHMPTAIAVETQFVAKNPLSSLTLSMAKGVIALVAEKNSLPLFEYTPRGIKKSVSGNGNASKETVQKMVTLLFNCAEKLEEDAADACAIALCHAHNITTSEPI